MQVQKRWKIDWDAKPSVWEQNQARAAKRREYIKAFKEQQAMLSYSMFSSQQNMTAGLVQNTMQGANDRIQKQAQAKLQEQLDNMDALSSQIDKLG